MRFFLFLLLRLGQLTLALGVLPAAVAAPGGGDIDNPLPVENSVLARGSVPEGGDDLSAARFYEVRPDPGSEVLEVRLFVQAGDADLFVGPTLTADYRLFPYFSIADGLNPEAVRIGRSSNPAIGSTDVWYIAVNGYTAAEYSLLVSWGSAEPATPLASGQPVSGQVAAGINVLVYPESTHYYAVEVPAGAESLEVTLTGMSGDGDLLIARVLSANPQDYDFISAAEASADEVIVISATTNPPLSASPTWYVVVHGFESTAYTLTVTVGGPEGFRFRRGDCNGDGAFDITDAVVNLGVLFLGAPPPPCRSECDSNGDDLNDISDAVATLGHLFLGGAPPPPPHPACGAAEPAPALGCERPSCP